MTTTDISATDSKMALVETSIDEITVFTNRALLSRLGKVSLASGSTELVVTNLPIFLDVDQIRAGGKSKLPVKISAVRTERVYSVEAVDVRVSDLQTLLDDLEQKRSKIESQQEGLALQRDFVKGLSEKSVKQFSQSLAQQQIDFKGADEMLAFLSDRWNISSMEIIRLAREQRNLNNEIDALREKLNEIQTPKAHESYSVFVTVSTDQPCEFELNISYFIGAAKWTPIYDLNLDTKRSKARLSYMAQVSQRTGEDWDKIRLTLSTAKITLGTLPPKLEPWYIDVPPPPLPIMPLPHPAHKSSLSPKAISPRPDFSANPDESTILSASYNTAEVSNEGGVVNFNAGSDNFIPSDGQPHKTVIFSDDYDCKLDFIAMPKIITQTFLRATIKNGNAQILPGKVNIYRENSYVGTTLLSSVSPGEEYKLYLGVDESIKVERQLVEREVDKTFVTSKRQTTYTYRIILTNLRDFELNTEVSDQLPVSRNEQIKVKLTRSQPIVQIGELGLLQWKLTLPPKSQREISFQFAVEQPREINKVSGLDV